MARLSGLDVAFRCLETRTRPMHMGAVTLFQPDRKVDHDDLVVLLASRAAAAPVLRRRAHTVWFPPGGAEWRDDARFDAADHVRGYRVSDRRTFEAYASGWMATPLDLSRPPWDLHVVTGLPGGEFAVLLKLHHSLADGAGAVGVGSALLDQAPPTGTRNPDPAAASAPVAGDLLRQGREAVERAGTMLRAVRRPPAPALVSGRSAGRRLAFVRLDAADVRQIRRQHGGTTNDVALTVIAGGLRDWLTTRDLPVEGVMPRAPIPVNTRARGQSDRDSGQSDRGRGQGDRARRQGDRAQGGRGQGDGGNQLSGYLCDLPVGLADPVARLRFVRSAMDRHKAAGPLSGPGTVPILANLIPPAVHRTCTPAAGAAAPLLSDTVVTNVPLPPMPLTLGGAALREIYPFAPLAAGHSLGVAISAYRDFVHIGLQADSDAIPDVDVLAACVAKSSATLHELCA